MNEFDDWEYEISDENKPSGPELFKDTMVFLATVAVALIRIVIFVGVPVFFIWLIIKLAIFLAGV